MADNTVDSQITLGQTLPDLLVTQLLAAEVFSAFVKWSDGQERDVWRHMLAQEIEHVTFVHSLLSAPPDVPSPWPAVRLDALRETCAIAMADGPESALSRVVCALRLEHGEIDFGLETFALGPHAANPNLPNYPGRIEDHYNDLLAYAHRYAAAREVAGQIARIAEHFPGVTLPGTAG